LLRLGNSPMTARHGADFPQVLTNYSGKGGDGKSTLTAFIAALAARFGGMKVLIIDNDMNSGRQGLHWNVSDRITDEKRDLHSLAVDCAAAKGGLTAELFERRLIRLERVMEGLKERGPGQLDLLPGLTDVTEAACPELAGKAGQRFVTDLIAFARGLYDLVVIDNGSQPFLGAHAAALASADRIFFINSTDRTSLVPNHKIMGSIIERFGIPKSRFSLVINRYSAADDINLNDVAKVMGTPVVARIQEDTSRMVTRALNNGVPFVIGYHLDKGLRTQESEQTYRDVLALMEEVVPDFKDKYKQRVPKSGFSLFNR
jgi:pilus assembly protein CpaE